MIDIEEVTEGEWNGKMVWICDLRYHNYSDKPIRNVKPVEVLVRHSAKTNKMIYDSKSHLVKLNKKGVPLKSGVIALFDTTSRNRGYGVPVKCFETKEECIKFYKSQLKTVIDGLEEYKQSVIKMVDSKILELKEL